MLYVMHTCSLSIRKESSLSSEFVFVHDFARYLHHVYPGAGGLMDISYAQCNLMRR